MAAGASPGSAYRNAVDVLSTEQESLNLEFALKENQFAWNQNIADGRDVMGILPAGYGKTLIYTIIPRVLDVLRNKHLGRHTVLVMPPDDGNSQNMHLRSDSLLGAFTKPNESRISETFRNLGNLLFTPRGLSSLSCIHEYMAIY